MKIKSRLAFSAALSLGLLAAVSCGSSGGSRDGKYLVINELMPSNRTGLQLPGGGPEDWIEIKNTGNDSISLEDFTLVVTKEATADNPDKEGKEEKEKVKSQEWSFPDVKIGGGECLVVFAKKAKDKDGAKTLNVGARALQADLKLPKEGATVSLLAPDDKVVSEVKYGPVEPDQALVLQPDSTYSPTFWQSPGFDNDREGYLAATAQIEGARRGPVLIWELMSRAEHSYENWVELKNVSDKSVSLAGYSLSRKPGKGESWSLPATTLAPGQIVSFQLAGSHAPQGSASQADIKLGSAESLVLLKDGRFADGLCARLSPFGGSVGRKSGGRGFYFFSTPSRNAENAASGSRSIADKPEWSHKPGVYKDQKRITLRLKDAGRRVHYTLDGSEPTMNSPVVKDSIVLTKPTVVRSFAEGDSVSMRSNVATASYLLGVDHDLPVINISIPHDDMYGYERGIYANGPGYGGEFPYSGANFWKKWTRKAHMELFDGKEGFASDCGLKIFGGYSRALPKKSLRIKFRGQFGDSKVNYDFFDNGQPLEIEDLVLRSGSQDYNKFMIRDEFFTSLAQSGSETNSLLTQMYRPVALYINAEYFGLYYLREKIDKNFVARKLNVPDDSIDVFLSGPSPYKTLEAQIASMDMSRPENFELARKNIDFNSLIDYKIGNIFSGKWDTGNIRYARSRHPESDGKWRFVYYDIDASWSSNPPAVAFSLSTSPGDIEPEKARHNVLIASLLKNKEFRALFLQRFANHLANTYSVKNTTDHFDKFIGRIRGEMKRNCERWSNLSYEQWEKNIKEFRDRLEGRPQKILDGVRSYLNVTPEEEKKYFAGLGY